MRAAHTLITGGDGYLGRRLVQRYLEQTDDPVIVWVRASDADEFQNKQTRLNPHFARFGDRVLYQWGDLVKDHPFDSVNPRNVRTIIHTAAVTRFNVDEDTARKVNIEGTEKLLKFASQCDSLEAFGLTSTVYASGLTSGPIAEVPFDPAGGFANHYESSKCASEAKLMSDFDYLPWRILRVATAVADDDSGRVTQFNAFHNTLKLLFYGLVSILPGKAETPLYFVTGEFVTKAIFTLMRSSTNRTIYHVCHTRSESQTLGQLIDVAYDYFAEQADFKSRRILHPLYVDIESFGLLGDAMDTFGGSIVNQALSSVAPFARQLFVEKEFLNDNLRAALDDYGAPDPKRMIQNTCEYLVRTKWGREQRGDVRTDN